MIVHVYFNANLVVTNAILLVGSRKRDGRDDGTGFSVWFRPDMDSSCAETIMAGFMGSPVSDGATVGKSGRLVEVRGCRGHYCCYARRRKKEAVATSSGTTIWVFIFVGCRGFSCSRRNRG